MRIISGESDWCLWLQIQNIFIAGRVEEQSLLDRLRHTIFFLYRKCLDLLPRMPRFDTQKNIFFIKCSLTCSESKYVFCCYTIKLTTKNTTVLQDKSASTACAIYLVYICIVYVCHTALRWHIVFHLILGSIKYLKHVWPFCPHCSKVRFPMWWTFFSSYQFFSDPFTEEASKSLMISFLKHWLLLTLGCT